MLRLHPKNQLPMLHGSAPKLCVLGGGIGQAEHFKPSFKYIVIHIVCPDSLGHPVSIRSGSILAIIAKNDGHKFTIYLSTCH